jgi:hypothetical protein
VIVLSDAELAGGLPSTASPSVVQWVRVGRRGENAAVTRVTARPSAHGGGAGQVLVTVNNYGWNPRDTDIEVSVDGRSVHRASVRLAPQREQSLHIPLADLGQVITARIAGEDALPVDDVRSARGHRASVVRVAFVGPRGSFVHRAVEVNPTVVLRLYDVRTAGADLDRAWSNGVADIAVCDRCPDAPTLAPTLVATPSTIETSRAPVVLASAAHPVAAALEPGREFATASGGPMLPAGAEVLLRVGSAAAAVAIEQDGRRRVELRFDLSQHDFALTPTFPILIANAIEWLSGQGELSPEVIAGQPLTIPRRGAPVSMVRALGPDGRPRTLRHLADESILADTDIAGDYRINVGGSERLVVVNPAVETESDLSAPLVVTLDRPGVVAASAATGFDAAPWLSLLAVGLLAVDWRFRTLQS